MTTPDRRRDSCTARRGRRWSDDRDLADAFERAQVALSALLGELRARAGWSMDQQSYASGVNRQTILELEKTRTDPQLSTLVRLAFVHGFELHIDVRRPWR